MSQSPSSAITTFSPVLTRCRARDKLDSAPTCDGHCKNKSTLTDTSANFTDHPHPLSSPSVQPTSLVTFQGKPHNVFLKQLRHILRLNFRHCHTNLRIRSRIIARTFTTFPDHLKLKSYRETMAQYDSNVQLISNNFILQIQWYNRTDQICNTALHTQKNHVTKPRLGPILGRVIGKLGLGPSGNVSVSITFTAPLS